MFASDLENYHLTLLQEAEYIPTFFEINKADGGKQEDSFISKNESKLTTSRSSQYLLYFVIYGKMEKKEQREKMQVVQIVNILISCLVSQYC